MEGYNGKSPALIQPVHHIFYGIVKSVEFAVHGYTYGLKRSLCGVPVLLEFFWYRTLDYPYELTASDDGRRFSFYYNITRDVF